MENPETELSSTSTSRSREIPSSQVIILKSHTSQVTACAWCPSASILASCSEDMCIWPIYDLTFGCGSCLKTDPTKMVVVKYIPGPTLALNLDPKLKQVAALEWNEYGTHIATGVYDGQARIWNLNRGAIQGILIGHTAPINTLKWNKGWSYILTGSSDKTAIAWDLHGPNFLKQRFKFHSGSVMDVDWRDKDSFATCSTDHTIHVCKIGETRPIKTFSGHKGGVNCVRWDPTGSLLASCSEDYTVKIWSMEQEERVHNFMEHEKEVHVIRWSPTGPGTKILASGSADSTVKLWDVNQGKLLYSLAGHWGPILSLDFSPNGEYLASGADDRVNIWLVKDGQLIRSYKSSKSNGCSCVSWSKEGDNIAAGFSDGTVHVFKMM